MNITVVSKIGMLVVFNLPVSDHRWIVRLALPTEWKLNLEFRFPRQINYSSLMWVWRDTDLELSVMSSLVCQLSSVLTGLNNNYLQRVRNDCNMLMNTCLYFLLHSAFINSTLYKKVMPFSSMNILKETHALNNYRPRPQQNQPPPLRLAHSCIKSITIPKMISCVHTAHVLIVFVHNLQLKKLCIYVLLTRPKFHFFNHLLISVRNGMRCTGFLS